MIVELIDQEAREVEIALSAHIRAMKHKLKSIKLSLKDEPLLRHSIRLAEAVKDKLEAK